MIAMANKWKLTLTWKSGHIESQIVDDFSIEDAGGRLRMTIKSVSPKVRRSVFTENLLSIDMEEQA